jgi:membrane protein implicated in regulation of membrane protease activity
MGLTLAAVMILATGCILLATGVVGVSVLVIASISASLLVLIRSWAEVRRRKSPTTEG